MRLKSLVLILLVSAAVGAKSENFVDAEGRKWIYKLNSNDEVEVVGVMSAKGDITIPKEINGHKVVALREYAFGSSYITSIVVPDGIKIASGAFYQCMQLERAVLPNDLEELPDSLFYNCFSLIEVNIPPQTKRIGDDAFFGCKLERLDLPATIESIGGGAFYMYQPVTIHIPDLNKWLQISFGTTTRPLPLEYRLYVNGEELTDLVIPAEIENMNSALCGCRSIKSVTIPSTVKSISPGAFNECSNIRHVEIDSVEHWFKLGTVAQSLIAAAGTFHINGEVIKDIVVPDSITDIDARVLSGNAKIESLTFHENVRSISGKTLDLKGLARVNIPSLEMWCKVKIESAFLSPLMMNKQAECYVDGECITDLVIPEGVTEIADHVFHGWTQLTSIHIPDSLVGGSGDLGTCSITNVYANSLEHWMSLNLGIGTKKHLFVDGEEIVDLVVPESITGFYGSTFSGLDTIRTADVHAGVTTVHNGSISTSPNITHVKIPSGLGLMNTLFPNSYQKIEVLELSEGAEKLGAMNIVCCTNLKRIVMPSSVAEIEALALPKNRDIEIEFSEGGNFHWVGDILVKNENNEMVFAYELPDEFAIPAGIEVVGAQALAYHGNITTLVIPEGVKRVEKDAFSLMSGLTSLKIYGPGIVFKAGALGSTRPTSVETKSIEQWCSLKFEKESDNPLNFTGQLIVDGEVVTELRLPEGVEIINDYAFYGASSIVSVCVPSTLRKIGKWAFGGAPIRKVELGHAEFQLENFFGQSLTNITFRREIDRIAPYAFANQASLKSIEIPDSVTEIGEYAFYGCSSLAEFELPPLVTNLPNRVFGKVPWTGYIVPSRVTTMGDAVFMSCPNLSEILFEGDAPQYTGSTFSGLPANCIVTVPPGAKGWKVAIPGELPLDKTTRTVHIRYVPCETCIDDEPIYEGKACQALGTNIFYCAVCREFLRKEEAANPKILEHVAVEHITGDADRDGNMTADYKCKDCGRLMFSGITRAVPQEAPNYHSSRPQYGGEGPYYELVDDVKWRYFVTNEVAFVRYEEYWTPAIPRATAGELVVPERLGRWPLTMLRESPFINCEYLTSITIPASITNVEDSVFYATRALERIIFLGDAPRLANHPFYRTWATVYVMPGSKGWNVPIPGAFPMVDYDYEEVFVDYLIENGKEAESEATLKAMKAANPKLSYWDCYVAGLNADNSNSVFKTKIEMVDGKPKVSYEPDLGDKRVYTTYGSSDLKNWRELTDETAADYRFFKVGVEMAE